MIFVVGQGWFTRVLIPRIGERGAILIGLAVSVMVSIAYGAVTQGWMMYAVMPFAISGWTVAQPAVQGLMSRAVPANEQGLLQGALASVTNLASIGGPLIWTGLFGYFVSANAPVVVPGMAFYVSRRAVFDLPASDPALAPRTGPTTGCCIIFLPTFRSVVSTSRGRYRMNRVGP
ncbi:MAG: hypothetical protein WDM81_18880 [Rhizomicrobium sp.]